MNALSKHGKLLSLFLLLPTVFLAIYVAFIANSEIEIKDVEAVSISDGRYKHRYSGKTDIEQYVDLILLSKNNAVQKIEDKAQTYTIEFELKNGDTKTDQFYPSVRDKSLLKDGTGFVRTVENVDELLLRVEYESLFKERHLPQVFVCTTNGNVLLAPNKYAWSFKKTGDEFYQFDGVETSEKNSTYNVSAEVLKKELIFFSVQPDELRIEYISEGNSYSDVKNLSLKEGDKIEIAVSARWEENELKSFFGEGKWIFEAVYKDSPLITIDKSEFIIGDCIVLNVENVDAGETIVVETDIDTYKSPVVYSGKDKRFILIPVGVGTTGGDYIIKASYGDSSFWFNVKITGVSNGFFMKTIDAETYNAVTSPSGIEEYESYISSLISKTSNGFLWESPKLSKPVDSEVDIPFACEILYNGLPPQVYFEGESYSVPQKTSVKSAGGGKVVFAGETLKTGKAVVLQGHRI